MPRKQKADEAVATVDAPSFEDLARKRVREQLGEYRELVGRAAAGEKLDEQTLARVLEVLDDLRLPQAAWSRDVIARRDFDAAEKAAAESLAKKPAQDRRLVEVVARLAELEEEVRSLRGERHSLSEVEPMVRVQYSRTCNELAARHPHLLFDLDDSVRRYLEAHARQATRREPETAGAWE